MTLALERPAAPGSAWDDEQLDLNAERRRRRQDRTRRLIVGAVGIAGVVAVWQLLAVALADSVILPSPAQTARALAHYLNSPYPSQSEPLWRDLVTSLRRILLGFAIGVAVGVLIGALMASVRTVRQLLDPVVEIIRPLPPLAFIPLFIVWFGIGETPKVFLIAAGTIPVMIIATVTALDRVPDDLGLCAETLGASRLYVLWHVRLRSALPGIVTGMRIAMGGAWTSIVAAEMLAATSGVGFLIQQAGNYLNTRVVFAGIITIAVTELALDTALRQLLRFADPAQR